MPWWVRHTQVLPFTPGRLRCLLKDLQELVTGEGPGDNAFSLFSPVY